MERAAMVYQKPARLLLDASQKFLRGSRIMLRGRGAPNV